MCSDLLFSRDLVSIDLQDGLFLTNRHPRVFQNHKRTKKLRRKNRRKIFVIVK